MKEDIHSYRCSAYLKSVLWVPMNAQKHRLFGSLTSISSYPKSPVTDRSECSQVGYLLEKLYLYSTAVLLLIFFSACSGNNKEKPIKEDPQASALIKKAEELTDKGYDLKLTGRNGNALSLFEQAAKKIINAKGENCLEYASNLDDRASIYFRTGNIEKAFLLYNQAKSIIERIEETNTRLFAAVMRRLTTMEAFKNIGYICKEPMVPEEENELPYFPKKEDIESAFQIFNIEMKSCLESHPHSVPIWTVITGDGRVALSSVKSEELDKQTKNCLEQKLSELSSMHSDLLPRFRACFYNYTYPMAFRKKQ